MRVAILLVTLFVAHTATASIPAGEPPAYFGPDGCDAPLVHTILDGPEGELGYHDANGDGHRDPGELVILGGTTSQVGDFIIAGPGAGGRLQEAGWAVQTGLQWRFFDADGDGRYTKGDDLVIAHGEYVVVGDVLFPATAPGRDVEEGDWMMNNGILTVDLEVRVRDLDGDGVWGDGDEVRAMPGATASLGDLILSGDARGLPAGMLASELPLHPLSFSLARAASSAGDVYFLARGDTVAPLDVYLHGAHSYTPGAMVRASHAQVDAPLAILAAPLMAVDEHASPDHGAIVWDLDSTGTLTAADAALPGSRQVDLDAGHALREISVAWAYLDLDWDGAYSPFDSVVLDVDGNGRFSVNDVRLDDGALYGGHPYVHGAAGRLFQPGCANADYTGGRDLDDDGLPDANDPDPDGDGLLAADDNCDHAYNPGQDDADGDGVGDACEDDADGDGYPAGQDVDDLDPRRATGIDSDGDGIDDVFDDDADGDGVHDAVDNCPGLKNDQADRDQDGQGDACEVVDDHSPYEPEDASSGRADRQDPDAGGHVPSDGTSHTPEADDVSTPGLSLIMMAIAVALAGVRRR